MKVPRQTAARVHHFGSAPERGASWAPWLPLWLGVVMAAIVSSDVYGRTLGGWRAYTSPVRIPDELRRRDAHRTRQRLLDVAGRHFAEHGFGGTSVRAIASDAGVAANLITRYFGGKAGLFAAATTIDLQARAALPGPAAGLGDRIADRVVERWESADAADPLLMMIRSAGSSPAAAQALAKFFTAQASGPLAEHLAATLGCMPGDAADRASAVGALILGVVTSRYVMRSGPLACADRASLTAWLGDRLQRLLDGPPSPPLVPSPDGQARASGERGHHGDRRGHLSALAPTGLGDALTARAAAGC